MAKAGKKEMNYTRQAASLTWDGCRELVDEETLTHHEGVLGFRLPDDLRSVLSSCHGGTPLERSDFDFDHPELGEVGSCIGALAILDAEYENGLLALWRDLQEYQETPREIVPFAMDGGGDYICLDYRKSIDKPAIVYWAHEAESENAIVFLAGSFTEFLDMLEPPEPLSDE